MKTTRSNQSSRNRIQDILPNFDVEQYLNASNIDFETETPENDKGWLGINCPWCVNDPEKHLGVHRVWKTLHCWRCSVEGTALKLVMKLEHASMDQALDIMARYSRSPLPDDLYTRPRKPFVFPKELIQLESSYIPPRPLNYLTQRGFNPYHLVDDYQIFYPEPEYVGSYKFRLVFPLTIRKQIVSLVGRDTTGTAVIRYLEHPEFESIRKAKHCLYGYDEVSPGSHIILVEGILDKLKMGKGILATLGTGWTSEQVSLLRSLHPSKVTILFDPEEEAQLRAVELCKQIWFCPTEVALLEGVEDPGALTLQEAEMVKRNLYA